MYPNWNAEYARKGFTLDQLVDELRKRGINRTASTMSLKFGGKAPITLKEAKILKDIVGTELSLDVLFAEAAE